MTIRQTGFFVYDEQPFLEVIPHIYEAAPKVEKATIYAKDDASDRASKVSWITPDNQKAQVILDHIWPVVHNANETANWNFDIAWCEPLQFTEYEIGEKYDWHIDTLISDIHAKDVRKISFSILLNDEFEGGDFQLEVGSPESSQRIHTVKLKKGDMVIFPSYTWHRVLPVTKGSRHSLVGWIHGPNWR